MKKMTLPAAVLIAAAAIITGCAGNVNERLNSRASEEYLEPVRPGYEGRNPFWNGFATKFIYAPAFGFPEVEGAARYRFTVEYLGTEMVQSPRYRADQPVEDPEPRWILGEGKPDGRSWTFEAAEPTACLAPVWNDIPVGLVRLTVTGLDGNGGILGTAGQREFLRDFPFHAPYNSNVRPYIESVKLAALYIHELPAIRHWLTSTTPDLSYRLNTYACKVIGSTIRMECLVARLMPRHREEAELIARNAARFLMDNSRPADAPLACFPPTYYGGLISSAREENQGKTMTMEACYVGNAFLDLYDLTGDRTYLDFAVNIARTYLKLQAEDGSWPIKVDYETGEPVNGCKAMLTPVMEFFSRLQKQYGVEGLGESIGRAERWMRETALASFDMTAQFEDMTVLNQKPYQNLTECASAPYASWLLKKEDRTPEETEAAVDLIRFSEDQFVCWDVLPGPDGTRTMMPPAVYEQYGYRMPIDHSTAVMAEAFMDLYEATGDRLALAKAKALLDNLTIVQNALTGQIPTSLDVRGGAKEPGRGFWTNCTFASVKALLRLAEITGNE